MADAGGQDRVTLGQDLTAGETTVRNEWGHLVIRFADGGSLDAGQPVRRIHRRSLADRQIEQIVFADGTVWDQAQLRALALAAGGADDDVMFGLTRRPDGGGATTR